MIYGNKEGVRDLLLARLESLYDWEPDPEIFVPAEMLTLLAGDHQTQEGDDEIYARAGETVTVLTWPGDTRHGMYLRYFRVTEGEELLMEGSSLWAVVDRESRKMLQPSQSGVEIPAEHTGMESRPPMAPKRREAPQTGLFLVPEDYLDGNGHMNNTRYFDLGQRELGMAKERLGELRAEFANEALLGDQLRLGRVLEEGLGYLSGESDRAGACFRMEWRERG